MDDLILRADVLNKLLAYTDGVDKTKTLSGMMKLIVRDTSSVDAVPVIHGHWVKVHGYVTPGGDPVWKCSECGKGTHTYGIEHGSYGADIADGQWVACPNCGAVMDES